MLKLDTGTICPSPCPVPAVLAVGTAIIPLPWRQPGPNGHSSRGDGPQSRHPSCSAGTAPPVFHSVPFPVATVLHRHVLGAVPQIKAVIHGERPDPVLETGWQCVEEETTKKRLQASSAGYHHHASPSWECTTAHAGGGAVLERKSSLPEAREIQ